MLSIFLSGDGKVDLDEVRFLARFQKAANIAISVAALEMPGNAELSVLLGSDDTLRELNRKWRNKDKSTNVLSFPGQDIAVGQPAGTILGDIAISLETANLEATLEKKELHDHITHLFVHGFLHLFGYDHQNDKEADLMESLERKVLAEFGIADPYA